MILTEDEIFSFLIVLGHSVDAASADSVLVQDKTILPIQLTPSTIENENMILTENEIFLPFFNEEGSGREENNEEIVEEETNNRREPRIMDDSVLRFLTYRTETSVSKVERVSYKK